MPVDALPPDTDLVVEDNTPFTLHYGHDGWADAQDLRSTPLGLGMHGARISGSQASSWSQIDFIRHYTDGMWDELGDQHVQVGAPRLTRLPSHSGPTSVRR